MLFGLQLSWLMRADACKDYWAVTNRPNPCDRGWTDRSRATADPRAESTTHRHAEAEDQAPVSAAFFASALASLRPRHQPITPGTMEMTTTAMITFSR